jgi:hypothetical protein
MTAGRISPEAVNAYVDGELPPARAAEVAALAADDQELAGAIATLHGLKSALHQAYPGDAVVIAAPAPQPRNIAPLAGCAAIAASAALLAAGIWLWGFAGFAGGESARPGQALAPVASLAPWTAETTALGSVRIPDISASGLAPAFVEHARAANGVPLAHVAYLGRHGCRLSLYAAPAGAPGAPEAFFPERGLEIASWESPEGRFFAVARGMDRARFAIISAALEAATTRPDAIGAQVQVALAEAHQPCAS